MITAALGKIAPAIPADVQFLPEELVWQLTLDQIESNTGRIIDPVTAPASSAGSSTYCFNEQNVLYSKLRPYLNKVICPNKPGIATTELVPLRPDPDRLDRQYLCYYLRSREFVSWVSNQVAGAKMPRVSMQAFWSHEVPLPSLKEQKRIAALLDKADVIRRKRIEALRLADDFLKSAFLDIFGDPVANPKGWPTINFGNAAPEKGQIVDGPFGSSLKPESYVDSGVRVIRNFNIGDDNFDESDYKFITYEKFQDVKRSEVFPGDLLISTKGTIGNVCQMPELPGKSVLSASGTVRIRLTNKVELRPLFVVAQMINPQFKGYLERFQAGTNQKYLNLSAIKEIQLIVPPLDLQDWFLAMRQKVRQAQQKGTQAFSESEHFFNSLVQRAFRGEL